MENTCNISEDKKWTTTIKEGDWNEHLPPKTARYVIPAALQASFRKMASESSRQK